MPESVLSFWKGRLLINKLATLEMGQHTFEFGFGTASYTSDQWKRKLATYHRERLQERFFIGRQPVNPRGEQRLNVGVKAILRVTLK